MINGYLSFVIRLVFLCFGIISLLIYLFKKPLDKDKENSNHEENFGKGNSINKNNISNEEIDKNNIEIEDDKNDDNTAKSDERFKTEKHKIKEESVNRNKFCENFCEKLCQNLKKKFLFGIFKENLYFRIMFLFLLIQTYFFCSFLLFSEKYISIRFSNKDEIGYAYIITDEFSRISLTIFISFFALKLIKWILDIINKLENENKCLKITVIIILIILLLIYFYFINIFLSINPNTEKVLLISTLISFAFYLLYYIIIISTKSLLESIIEQKKGKKNNCKSCVSFITNKIDDLL